MAGNRKHVKIFRLIQALCLCCIVLTPSLSHAAYYGDRHYKHHYRHYGHAYHRPYYKHHYGHHHRYRHHYGSHAHFSGTASYVVLGVLGAALLTHIFTNNKSRSTNTYSKTHTTVAPANVIKPKTIIYKAAKKTVYRYNEYEGWNQLASGNNRYSLDIFAIQSQKDLNLAEPKIGFALAAAAMGETDRANRMMRKAIRIDASALNRIDVDRIEPAIKQISENYRSAMTNNFTDDNDNAFMNATLAYLQQDYETTLSLIIESDQSLSANNLRELVKNKL